MLTRRLRLTNQRVCAFRASSAHTYNENRTALALAPSLACTCTCTDHRAVCSPRLHLRQPCAAMSQEARDPPTEQFCSSTVISGTRTKMALYTPLTHTGIVACMISRFQKTELPPDMSSVGSCSDKPAPISATVCGDVCCVPMHITDPFHSGSHALHNSYCLSHCDSNFRSCRGFRRLGAPFWMSFLAMFFVHGSFSYATLPTWIPDPTFPIYTNTIHKVGFP